MKGVFLDILQYSQETSVLESLFNKVAGLNTCNFIKKRLRHRYFPVNIAKSLRTASYRASLVAASLYIKKLLF